MFSLSQSPRKHSGFTLIELMVVMAIIAILATAGLSAYTGYIKKARDATRIADINAINTIILTNTSTTGTPPTISALRSAILEMNNSQPILDPLNNGSGILGKAVCVSGNVSSPTSDTPCNYLYQICDNNTYRVMASFESISNKGLYNVKYYYDIIGNVPEYYGMGDCGCPGNCVVNNWVVRPFNSGNLLL